MQPSDPELLRELRQIKRTLLAILICLILLLLALLPGVLSFLGWVAAAILLASVLALVCWVGRERWARLFSRLFGRAP